MKALLQRVSEAKVVVDGEIIGKISKGWLVLLGIGQGDSGTDVEKLTEKIVGLRLFSDAEGKFNLSVQDICGEILVISQFTLFADCRRGRRPGFTDAAPPSIAKSLYELFVETLQRAGLVVKTGSFGADMKVSLTNDGPVTVMLDSKELSK